MARRENPPNTDFFPPISCLKPIRGLDEDAYENYASFCRQDYPGDYEIVFCVDPGDPALPVLEKLVPIFPTARSACSSALAAMPSMTNRPPDAVGREAQNELLDITDGDIRVGPDYLRAIAHPFRDPKVGGATTLYVSTEETSSSRISVGRA